ncbi:DNA-binding barrel domain superfamily [Sesbania bispinosa]|nr:DNA-binding barrel domain superfamily [Sesbania bispinosa]
MTSKPINGDGFNGHTTSKPIHFFRIMHHETLSQGKLRIPEKFVRKYGESLSNTMFLKLPNGAEWKVDVEKHDDGRVWFQNGWKEFEEYYSLAHGHLLVFKFDGITSHFHVHIYDMSTMEIDYPLKKDEGILKNPTEEKRSIQQNTKRPSVCNYGPHEVASNTSFTMTIRKTAKGITAGLHQTGSTKSNAAGWGQIMDGEVDSLPKHSKQFIFCRMANVRKGKQFKSTRYLLLRAAKL